MATAAIQPDAEWVGSGFLMEAATDGGARRFRTRLAKLDTPIPRCPSGLDPNYHYVLTREAAQACAGSLVGKPARISRDFRDHYDTAVVDGERRRRLAMPYGALDKVEIEETPEGAYLVAEGNWWTMEEPAVANHVQANLDKFGSSYELNIHLPEGRWRQQGQTRYIDSFTGTGLALLLKDAAAYGELSQLVYAAAQQAEGAGELDLDQLPEGAGHDDADRKQALPQERREARRETEDAGVQAAGSGRTSMPEDKGMVDVATLVAETERRTQAEAELTSVRAAAAEVGEQLQAAGFASLTELLSELAAARASVAATASPLEERGFADVTALASAYDAAKAQAEELAAAVAKAEEVALAAAEESLKTRAERLFERLTAGAAVPDDKREALRALCRRDVEVYSDEELELRLLASGQPAASAPEAKNPPRALASADGPGAKVEAELASAMEAGLLKTPEQIRNHRHALWARQLSGVDHE